MNSTSIQKEVQKLDLSEFDRNARNVMYGTVNVNEHLAHI